VKPAAFAYARASSVDHAVELLGREDGARVLETIDFGVTWVDRTGPLPAGVAARALEVDWEAALERLFVGSGHGVYYSPDRGASWIKDGADLPNVNIGDLVIDRTNRTIVVGTYGRGAWKADLPSLACDADCDGDGVCDADEIALGAPDCNANGVPDECDVNPDYGGLSADCQANGVPDECELEGNDCDADGVPEECEADCNGNGISDPCDIAFGLFEDCDGNGVPDVCESLADCDADGTPDVCDPSYCAADLAPPYGTLNVFDFLAYQTAFGIGC